MVSRALLALLLLLLMLLLPPTSSNGNGEPRTAGAAAAAGWCCCCRQPPAMAMVSSCVSGHIGSLCHRVRSAVRSARVVQSMQQLQTAIQRNGPDNLGLSCAMPCLFWSSAPC